MEPSRRESLLRSAEQEFASHGYEGASINTILEQAGFSKGSFYYYFEDKADLAGAVLSWSLLPVIELWREAGEPANAQAFWDTLGRLQRRMLDMLEATPERMNLTVVLGGEFWRNETLRKQLLPLVAQSREYAMRFWKQGQSLGAVRTDMTVDQLMAIHEAVKRATWEATHRPGQKLSVEQVEAFASTMMDLTRRLAQPSKENPT